jgi:hypothetical protein
MQHSTKSFLLISIFAALICACGPSSFALRPPISLQAIPSYPQAQSLTHRTEHDLDEMTTIAFETQDTPQTVLAFYKITLQGYRWTSEKEQADALVYVDTSGCPWYSLSIVTSKQSSLRTNVRVRLLTGRCL